MSSDERGPAAPGRRDVMRLLGTGAVGAALCVPAVLSVRALVPNALYEPPQRFKAGLPGRFADGETFLAEQRVFIVRAGPRFHCLSAVCTHLGCTVQLAKVGAAVEYHCPCHGSKYRADGTNFAGPAPRPLAYHPLELAPDDGQLIVDLGVTAASTWRLTT